MLTEPPVDAWWTRNPWRPRRSIAPAYDSRRLFLVSALALTTAGIAASLRANTAGDLQRIFLDPIDTAHSAEMIGAILGIPFLGFAVTIADRQPAARRDRDGAAAAAGGHLLGGRRSDHGLCRNLAIGPGVYTVLWLGALVIGIGWGLVETVINPLMASSVSGRQGGEAERAACVVAGRAGDWRPARCGDVHRRVSAGRRSSRSLPFPPCSSPSLCVGVRFPPTERTAAGDLGGRRCSASSRSPLFSCCSCRCS